jgi:transcriptional regulator with XRE-family HTH domain
MDDMRVAAILRAVRRRHGWRQADVARRAGVSRSLVSLLERDHLDQTALATLRAGAAVLEIRMDMVARWRGGQVDRLLNHEHSAMHESVARCLAASDGWRFAPEVSFSVFGERGVIDILAFHEPTGSLLVIELKTGIHDVNELVGSVDRKRRLARGIAAERGWRAHTVSVWIIVKAGAVNQRRVASHRAMLAPAFPVGGHAMRSWVRHPSREASALSFCSLATPSSTRPRVAALRPPRAQTADGTHGPTIGRRA